MSDPYGASHRTRRAHLIAQLNAGAFMVCPFCHQPLHPGQRLDLDHALPLHRRTPGLDYSEHDQANRLAHAKCNRARGQRVTTMKNRRRNAIRRALRDQA